MLIEFDYLHSLTFMCLLVEGGGGETKIIIIIIITII